MQNAPVVTANKKTADLPSGQKSHDFLLDPLPVPEAIESDGDTVWGLWEDSLEEQKGQQGGAPAGDAHPDFEDTLAIDPDELDPLT